MRINNDLAAIHAYLCGDGYVTRNPPTQKIKYYNLGFRNTNPSLLKDFQHKFHKYFKIKPYLIECERCRIGSKDIYYKLTKSFGSFYSRKWSMPNMNKKLIRTWLRSFFDCEAWVFCKTHQNRHIGIDSVNEQGLEGIRKALEKIGIRVIKKTIKPLFLMNMKRFIGEILN